MNEQMETFEIAGPIKFIPKLALNYNECAQALGVSVSTVKRLVKKGELMPCRDGQQIALLAVDEVRKYLARHRERPLKPR